MIPSARQVVQAWKAQGEADAASFPPGPPGGLLTCFSHADADGRTLFTECSWIDQATVGQVLFDGSYASTLADAAAKTRRLRDAIEH